MKYTLYLLDKTAFGDNGYKNAGQYITEKTKEKKLISESYGEKKERPYYKLICTQ